MRTLGGLQSTRAGQDPDPADYSTGSVEIGDHADRVPSRDGIRRDLGSDTGGRGRQFSLVGDAELDEGAVWETVWTRWWPSSARSSGSSTSIASPWTASCGTSKPSGSGHVRRRQVAGADGEVRRRLEKLSAAERFRPAGAHRRHVEPRSHGPCGARRPRSRPGYPVRIRRPQPPGTSRPTSATPRCTWRCAASRMTTWPRCAQLSPDRRQPAHGHLRLHGEGVGPRQAGHPQNHSALLSEADLNDWRSAWGPTPRPWRRRPRHAQHRLRGRRPPSEATSTRRSARCWRCPLVSINAATDNPQQSWRVCIRVWMGRSTNGGAHRRHAGHLLTRNLGGWVNKVGV